jgi:hypothetical protein
MIAGIVEILGIAEILDDEIVDEVIKIKINLKIFK